MQSSKSLLVLLALVRCGFHEFASLYETSPSQVFSICLRKLLSDNVLCRELDVYSNNKAGLPEVEVLTVRRTKNRMQITTYIEENT